MVKDERAKTVFTLENGNDLNLGSQPINVGIRQLAGRLRAVNGQIMRFNAKAKRNYAQFRHVDTSARNVLQRLHQAESHQALERVTMNVG
jgi:hypothetical protein